MSIVIIRADDKINDWKTALLSAVPNLNVYSYLEEHQPKDIKMALVWKPPLGVIKNYPNLECIASSGAGVDFLFEDESLPKHVPITRVVDEYLAKDMSEHVIGLIFGYLKNFNQYKLNQVQKIWKPQPYLRIKDVNVGIMGLGALGKVLALDLVHYGFKVNGWSHSKKNIKGIQSFAGQEDMNGFLNETNVLVCLLPLTKVTTGILNKKLFKQLPHGAHIINVARGGHLVDKDLVEMIDNGHLSGASFDVYHQEPLATEHPFWNHPKINMTPHYASVSDTDSVVPQIIENYRRLASGQELLNLVSTQKGY